MSHFVNKEYILNIIKKIEHPSNFNLTEKIESINFSKQDVKIIVNSEFTSNTEKLTRLWQSVIEKDRKITSCSVIYTTHNTPPLEKNMPSKNQQFLLVSGISPTVPDRSWTALDVPLGPQVGPMLEASGRLGAFLGDLAAI